MKVIDFLFFYFVHWFKKRKNIKEPIERTLYVLSICSILWLFFLNNIIEYFLFNTLKSKIPGFIFVICAIIFYYLFKYIYVYKRRYYMILDRSNLEFNVSNKTGITISLIFFISSFIIPLLTVTILRLIMGLPIGFW